MAAVTAVMEHSPKMNNHHHHHHHHQNDNNNGRNCQECHMEQSIYQCPACNIRTCSLQCCQAHKTRTQCSGKRPRSEYLPLCRMNDSTLRSDYFFLEQVVNQVVPRARKVAKLLEEHNNNNNNNNNNNVAAVATTTLPLQQHQQQQQQQQQQSKSFNSTKQSHTPTPPTSNKKSRRLVQQAQKRNITLQLLPSFMERHQQNTSWYCGPRDMITWKVECIFIPPSSQKVKLELNLSEYDDNILERILALRKRRLDDEHNTKTQANDTTAATTTTTTTNQKHGTTFTSCDDDCYSLFWKRLPSPANQPVYIQLQPHTTLRTLLEGRTIVEHPTLYCVAKKNEYLQQFPTTTNTTTNGSSLIVEVEEQEEEEEEATTTTNTSNWKDNGGGGGHNQH
jgi:hypothetical protein